MVTVGIRASTAGVRNRPLPYLPRLPKATATPRWPRELVNCPGTSRPTLLINRRGEPMTDAELLAGAHCWRATPWNYSALAGLLLKPDSTGTLLFGHGQTIYAVILCAWEIPTPGVLRLTYHDSPPHQFF